MSDTMMTDSIAAVNLQHSEDFARSQGWLEHELTEPHEDLALFLEKVPGPRVLDAGCGWGRLAYHFLDAELHYVGVDFSPAMISAAQQHTPDASFATMAMPALQFPDASFDGIWCCCALHNEPKQQLTASLTEFHRVLAPGGLLHIVLPYERCSYEQMIYDDDNAPLLWYACYLPDELAEYVTQAGFSLTTSYTRDTDNALAILAYA